jgi:hypothetical protein
MAVNVNSEIICKEEVVVDFNILSQKLPEENEEHR